MTWSELIQQIEALQARAAELKRTGATFRDLVELQAQIDQVQAEKARIEMEMLRAQSGPVQ